MMMMNEVLVVHSARESTYAYAVDCWNSISPRERTNEQTIVFTHE